MQLIIIGLFLLKAMKLTAATCVLESEFGFILNCNFKKSGLFRVRNLGGLKAHFGLGFSLGDELGFGESLGNLEGNRRRALNYKTGFINKVGVLSPKIESTTIASPHLDYVRSLNQNSQNSSSMTEVMFLPLGVPTFRPIPKTGTNLVRRNDILLNEGINPNSMTSFQYLPEKARTNSTNIKVQSQIADIGLRNISSIVNKVNTIAAQGTYNKYQSQKPEEQEFNSERLKQKTQSEKHNKLLVKKSSSNNAYKDSQMMTVMNAPKEYYPSGYDKNFDDNFKSKVGLPPTNFTCAEQKYFPGLYANVDLGCMVFHVCAITDGGIIMKSFLCPESTLFDQSILKCNWWFYVDCNNSTYDSNIPISKSYQLMKSLSYFSNFTMI